MGMNGKTIAGAVIAAGVFALGGSSLVAQQNQSNNQNNTGQTTNQGSTSQDTNRDANRTTDQTTTQDRSTPQSPNQTTQDSNRTTQDTNRDSNRSTQGTSQDANRATGQQVMSRGGASALSSDDRKFVMDAAKGGMLEVEAGRLASQNGSSDAVKQLGERLVQEHTKANEELKALADSKGITLPQEMDAKHKATLTKMSSLSGAAFDREFIKEMQKDHKKDISMFQKQADKGKDADLKAFAAKTLPTLREHGQMIDQMAAGGGAMKSMSGMDSPSGTTSRPTSGTTSPSGTSNPSNTSNPSSTGNPPSSGTTNPSGSGTTRPNP